MRWMSKKVRLDSASSLVLGQAMDDEDASENAPKFKNEKFGPSFWSGSR